MTRTTLLQLLAHPAALTGADVHELEQLAQAFPYCQTAHLLLAKAAHDQGSMLASQRLRRAATYAADRARLRQLIEQVEPVLSPVAEPSAFVSATPAEPTLGAADPAETVSTPLVALSEGAAEPSVALLEVEHTILPVPEVLASEPEPEPPLTPEAEALQPEVVETEAAALEEAEVTEDIAAPEAAEPEAAIAANDTTLETPAAVAEELAAEASAPEAATVADDTLPEEDTISEEEEELPAQAPPIRPPAEAELAHAEFGLAEAEPAELTAYSLPAIELPLGITVDVLSTPLPAFKGDPGVGYAPSEGSRLGFCLQGLTTEYSLMTGPAALLPSTPLPPASEFFAPDALVLAHLATHQPLAPAPDASDLIDSFLRRSPQGAARRRSFSAHHQMPDDEQPDLSGPSTRVVPDLASENLAQILVRQGKIERAIATYERLIVKHPEKTAYFTAQIDLLRPSA
jgi:hypothetical protein